MYHQPALKSYISKLMNFMYYLENNKKYIREVDWEALLLICCANLKVQSFVFVRVNVLAVLLSAYV